MEREEKDSYKKLALAFKNSQGNIDSVLAAIKNDKTYDKLSMGLVNLKRELGEAIKTSQPDMSVITRSINSLALIMNSKKEFSDESIVSNLNKIERVLSKPKKHKPIKDRTDEIIKAIKNIKLEAKDVSFPKTIDVGNFPPTKTAMPATHMSINSLSGSVHPTSTTVKTTLTSLPGYGVLDNRRAIVFYNNSDDTTVFIGGSTVTTDTGLPIEAKSFSPSFDSGPLQKWYGVTSAGTADVRCVEIPDEASGR